MTYVIQRPRFGNELNFVLRYPIRRDVSHPPMFYPFSERFTRLLQEKGIQLEREQLELDPDKNQYIVHLQTRGIIRQSKYIRQVPLKILKTNTEKRLDLEKTLKRKEKHKLIKFSVEQKRLQLAILKWMRAFFEFCQQGDKSLAPLLPQLNIAIQKLEARRAPFGVGDRINLEVESPKVIISDRRLFERPDNRNVFQTPFDEAM